MKRYLAASIFALLMSSAAFAAKGPEIDFIDNKLSVDADSVSLGRLLQLVDLATGMKSKVPPELANRSLSVRLSGLSLTDAVRKMFQGQTFDYVVIAGQGIVITSASQNIPGNESPAQGSVYNSAPLVQPADQPFVQDFSPVQGVPFQTPPQQVQQQPAMVQTPFGMMANTRAQQTQTTPSAVPGQQQNSLFPQTTPFGQQPQVQQQPVQIIPGGQIGSPTPFGTPTPFGAPPATTPNNGLFNSSTPVFGTPGQPQQR